MFKIVKTPFFVIIVFISLLLFCVLDPKTCADVELENSEWEIKTLTSAIKHYLRFV